MGVNIALNLACAGVTACLTDVSATQLATASENARANAAFLFAQGLISENIEDVLGRIVYCSQLGAALDRAQLVIEAIPENLNLKLALFAELDRLCPPEVILASNTSTFLPSALAAGMVNSGRAARFLVLHYWNPAHLIPLVEIVPHPLVGSNVLVPINQLLDRCGKRSVVLRKEIPGFIGNRLAFALQREAMDLVAKGVASPEEIDLVVKSGFGRRLPVTGIFTTADLGGLDVYLAVCESLYPDLCASREPPAELRRLVEAGQLGVKTGSGWQRYSTDEIKALRESLAAELVHRARLDQETSRPGAADS